MALKPLQFTEWSKPFAPQAAKRLIDGAPKPKAGMPVDLGTHRVIVPSTFASRLIGGRVSETGTSGTPAAGISDAG